MLRNDDAPAIVINAHGVWDNTFACGVGLIPWAEIADVSLRRISRADLVAITSQDGIDLVARQTGWFKKTLVYVGLFLNVGTAILPTVCLPTKPAELVEQLRSFMGYAADREEATFVAQI